jgi:hypothetical protein
MAFAQGSRHGIAYVAETVYGVTPTTPTMKELRNNSGGLVITKDTFQSQEIRSDRQISDFRHGTRQGAGNIDFELSYGAFDDFLESALQGVWASNVLKAGTALKSFTIERRFEDISQYQAFTGCIVNTLSLSVAPNAMVTGTFGILGKDGVFAGTALGVPTAAPAHPPYDGFSGALLEGGVSVANVASIELNIDNGMRPAFVIGSQTTPQLLVGRSNITGTLVAFFENMTLLNKFLLETESSVELTLDGAAGGDLAIKLPRIKYGGGENAVTTSEDAVQLRMPFQALRGAADGSNIVVTRTPA